MRRIFGISVVFLGALVCVLLFNILLCAIMPAYKDMISSAAKNDSNIPVVEVSEGVTIVKENNEVRYITDGADSFKDEDTSMKAANEYFDNLDKKDSAKEGVDSEDDFEDEPVIIDRTYYEDCGTGKGYWVLTYSDGRKIVE
ncbi:hypothetical protein D6856_07815 [Butyrivibrio sp. XB500-5]|uniref:hypothetical protein n=1 Tax=Butyrivibrio sp. XB500-5 TaxID=2364880 RepID=UPI000EAA8DFE|nr:hypothetical protein [Butyrivibrio sp. XB500-5]RKM60945.1 hypothetical protein D6856_07815 [Butyrivibrio sp. XB500-5]